MPDQTFSFSEDFTSISFRDEDLELFHTQDNRSLSQSTSKGQRLIRSRSPGSRSFYGDQEPTAKASVSRIRPESNVYQSCKSDTARPQQSRQAPRSEVPQLDDSNTEMSPWLAGRSRPASISPDSGDEGARRRGTVERAEERACEKYIDDRRRGRRFEPNWSRTILPAVATATLAGDVDRHHSHSRTAAESARPHLEAERAAPRPWRAARATRSEARDS
jgi:hypothetical protein